MNKQKGFAPILLILLAVVVIGGGTYFYTNNKDVQVNTTENTSLQGESVSSTTNEILVKNKDKSFVSVGDKIGSMTVQSVEPFNSKFSNLSQNNAKIKLSGPVTITGMYQLFKNAEGFSGYCMSDFDEESIAKLPSLSLTDKTNWFCFRNEDVAKAKLGEGQVKTKVTVKIDNFELNRYPSEVVDRVDLVDVVLKNTETRYFRLYRKHDGFVYLAGQEYSSVYYKSTETNMFEKYNELDYLKITAESFTNLQKPEEESVGIKNYTVEITKQIKNISDISVVSETEFLKINN